MSGDALQRWQYDICNIITHFLYKIKKLLSNSQKKTLQAVINLKGILIGSTPPIDISRKSGEKNVF